MNIADKLSTSSRPKLMQQYGKMQDSCTLCMQNSEAGKDVIVKSANDYRDYRSITLNNGMRVMLVADMRTRPSSDASKCRWKRKPIPDTASTNSPSSRHPDNNIEKHSSMMSMSDQDEFDEEDCGEEGLSSDDSQTSVLSLASQVTSHTSNTSHIGNNKRKKRANKSEALSDDDEDEDDNRNEVNIKKKKTDWNKNETEKLSAAALCVNTGSFSDPPDIPGLAHLLEHMLFMGSNKYPDENEFDSFLKAHGGNSNAYTECERTVFHFDIPRKQLKKALDIFAQFFISPLMKKESIDREINAVDSEFDMSKLNDANRKEQLLSYIAKKGHPMGKFFWGNHNTLKNNPEARCIDVYARLQEFYLKHYCARNMILAVQSRDPLDTMEQWVRNMFEDVRSSPHSQVQSSLDEYSEPFNLNEFHKLYKIVPVNNTNKLELLWSLPPMHAHYRIKPLQYIAYWMGHECQGSLLAYLKKQLWASNLACGNYDTSFDQNKYWSAYCVSIELTEQGIQHVPDVVHAVFECIATMSFNGVSREFFEELQSIECNNFRWMEQGDAVDHVSNLCVNMNHYDLMDLLTGDSLFLQYDDKLTNSCMGYLAPRRCNINITSKKFEGQCDLREPWYQTHYSVQDIPSNWLEMIQPRSKVFLPPARNNYIATDFSIHPLPNPTSTVPVLITDQPHSKLWYKQDHKFKTPKAHYRFMFKSHLINQSPTNEVLMDIFIRALRHNLAEITYNATIAGLEYNIKSIEKALLVKFGGFNDKLKNLVLTVIDAMVDFDLDEEVFVILVDQLRQFYYNQYISPENLVKETRLNLLQDRYWSSVDRQNQLAFATREMVLVFARNFKSQLFLEGLVMGNVTKAQAHEVENYIISKLGYAPLPKYLLPVHRVVELPNGQFTCRIRNFNQSDTNSVITNYYQQGPFTLGEHALNELLMVKMEEPCFDILRTREQLGYTVFNTNRNTMGILGFSVTVCSQAHKWRMDELDQKIDSFLKEFEDQLERLSEEDFNVQKASLVALKSCEDTYLEEEVERFWDEIVTGTYFFQRLEKEMVALDQVTLRALRHWFKSQIGRNMKKLSVQVAGNDLSNDVNMDVDGASECPNNCSFTETVSTSPSYNFLAVNLPRSKSRDTRVIDDFRSFKDSLKLYPVSQCIDDIDDLELEC